MSSDCYLLILPDLVLHNICKFITCPFDLLYFGSTCTRLHKITLSESLWWSLAFYWFKGVWVQIENTASNSKPREGLLKIMRLYASTGSSTRQECIFSNGEEWNRTDTRKLRFLIGILRLTYYRPKDYHPAILHQQWLYDIGLYQRISPCIDYTQTDLELSENVIFQLSSLSQASERDLRRRKQPFKDPKYYIKRISTSEDWVTDLFPFSLHGSVCPLLMCPFQDSLTMETSGLEGLSLCISIIVEKHLKYSHIVSNLLLNDVGNIIKLFQSSFLSQFHKALSVLEERFGKISIKDAVLILLEEHLIDLTDLNNAVNVHDICIKTDDVLLDIANLLKNSESIDHVVDEVRLNLRKSLNCEIEKILFPNCIKGAVTRLNLTDSDLIGGDNSHQEMSSAAFISNKGVLVTWHLIGKMRY